MLDWTHSGISVDLSVKIAATSSKEREALAQCISSASVSPKRMLVGNPLADGRSKTCERHASSVLYQSQCIPYLRTHSKLFAATEFLVEVLRHFPGADARLIVAMGYTVHGPVARGPASPTSSASLPTAARSSTSRSPLSTSSMPARSSPISPYPPGNPPLRGRDCSQKCTTSTRCVAAAVAQGCESSP